MFYALKFFFLIIYRFVFIFFIFSLVFICTFYLKYKFMYLNFSIFNYNLYYNAYIYSFPLSLVVTFMRISYPFDLRVLKSPKAFSFFYFLLFIFILLFSYLGFLAGHSFNHYFIEFNKNNNFNLKDDVVHFVDNKVVLYSKNSQFFGFNGYLIVEGNRENDNKGFLYQSDLSELRKINLIKENDFLDQRAFDNFIHCLFGDLKILNQFLFSLKYQDLVFNILGIALLLFAFSYIFNLIYLSSFLIFLYPIFIILFFKIYNVYSVEFPKIYNVIIGGEGIISAFIPLVFCFLTFLSTYLFSFVSEYVKTSNDLTILKR